MDELDIYDIFIRLIQEKEDKDVEERQKEAKHNTKNYGKRN